ncbi:MAG: hypothetical protein KDE31_22670, partial [Caldilineaceae bacterium]|nr:hypothetical protein [Caldilineaceae bacterium]
MPSLDQSFNELLTRLQHGADAMPTGVEPIYYLIFDPSDILTVKRRQTAWQAKLRNDGWNVHTFSMAQAVNDILTTVPQRKLWLTADATAPQNWARTNQALANALNKGSLRDRLAAELQALAEESHPLLLVTDLEALHPYLRIGTIEAQLYGKFTVPTVFFYPGKR